MKKEKKLYKFLRTGLKSQYGDCMWKIGEWKKEDRISICGQGFHASKTPLQALGYVGGEILAEVVVKGKSVIEGDKECWSEMKIVKAWHWTKEDSVALSIYGAELCIENFEKIYPDDKRPREAIEAAKKWLLEPTDANQSAARSAAWSAESAARSARSAARSAESAAWSAESAAWSARSAESAAWSAESAAWSAESAAWSAAWSAARSAESAKKDLIKKLDAWFIKRIKSLKKYE